MSQDTRDTANLGLIKKTPICISESLAKACGLTQAAGGAVTMDGEGGLLGWK